MNYIIAVFAAIAAILAYMELKSPKVTVVLVLLALGTLVLEFVKNMEEGKEKKKQANEGNLNSRVIYPPPPGMKFPRMEIGASGTIFESGNSEAPFKIADDNNFALKIVNDKLFVTCTIRNNQGLVVAELVENEWRVHPAMSFDRNFTPYALEVKDGYGDVVLQVRLLPDRVRLQAVFYDRQGRGIKFVENPYGEGGLLGWSHNPGWNELKIRPIFRYPSSSHFGELLSTSPK